VLAVVAVPIRRLDPDLPLPAYAKPGDAGCDLLAAETVTLAAAGGRAMVPTGIAVAIPPGYAGFVQPRSGLQRVEQAEWHEVETLDETERGLGGFGHSGR